MELKPGYKQTELGVIPEDWQVAQIGELKPFITSGSRGWASYYSDRGSLFVRITNLLRDTIYLDLKNSKFVNLPPDASEGTRTQLQEHDVLISITADIGIVGYVDSRVPTPTYINQHIALVRFDPAKTSGKFVSYFLASEKPQKLFRASTDVGAKAGMSLLTVNKLQLAFPSHPEQRAIAGALSDVDALIGGLDQLIAKKRDLKQAAMQQLLTGQKRLPGFHGEWEVKRLGEIADVKTGPFGSSLHESDYVRDGTPIITVEHLGEFGVTHFNLPLVSDSDRHRLRAYSLEIGDIVFSRVGSVDRNALISPGEEGWLFSGRLLRVRTDRKKAFAPFLSYQFHGEAFKGLVRNVAVGQTMACLNTQILKGIAVVLPSLPEQTAIAEVLSDMDAELAALEQRRDKTRALKQGMMQELLTGKTRLVDSGKLRVESGERRTS